MKCMRKITKVITCAAMTCILALGIVPESASAEEGATVIINGGGNAAPEATPEVDAYASGNRVIIVAPTTEPAPTEAPQVQSGEVTDESTASINLNNNNSNDSEEVYVEEENTDVDYIVADDSDKKAKATAKPTQGKVKKTASYKVEASDDEDIPKTGVVHWEFVFAGAGFVLLLAGTYLSVRYLKSDRN